MFVFFFSFLSSIEFHHYSHSCWLWYTENEATQTSPPTPGKRNPQSVFPPSNSNIPLPHPHQSQGKPSSYMLSPRGEKKEKRKKEGKKNKPYKRKKKEHMKEAQSPKNVESGEICTGVIPVLTTVGQCMFIHTGHHHYLHWTLDRCQFHQNHGLDHCRLQHWRETWKETFLFNLYSYIQRKLLQISFKYTAGFSFWVY